MESPDLKPKKKTKPPSFQQAWCGICGESLQRRHMKRHNANKHNGASLRFVDKVESVKLRRAWEQDHAGLKHRIKRLQRPSQPSGVEKAEQEKRNLNDAGPSEPVIHQTGSQNKESVRRTIGDTYNGNNLEKPTQSVNKLISTPAPSLFKNTSKNSDSIRKPGQTDHQTAGPSRQAKPVARPCHSSAQNQCQNSVPVSKANAGYHCVQLKSAVGRDAVPAPSKVLAPEVADPSRTTSLSDKRSKGGSTIVKEGNRFWHEQVDRVEESEAYRKLNAAIKATPAAANHGRMYLPKHSQRWHLKPTALLEVANTALEGTPLYFQHRVAASHLPELCEFLNRRKFAATYEENRSGVGTIRNNGEHDVDQGQRDFKHGPPSPPAVSFPNVESDDDEEYPAEAVLLADSEFIGTCAQAVNVQPGIENQPSSGIVRYSERINKCRTLDSLISTAEEFAWDPETNSLVCNACHQAFNNHFGKIHYDPMNTQNREEEFMKLKQTIVSHVSESNCHRQATGQPPIEVTPGVTTALDREAGLNIGTIAYNCVKLKTGYNKFKDFLRVTSSRRFIIGDINHSKKIASALNVQYYMIWKEHMKKEFSRNLESTQKPNYFSIVADKCTPHSDTLHVVGIIFPYKDKLEPYLIGLVDNQCGTGKGLATGIYGVLLEYFQPEEIPQRLVGASWDGEYVNNKVHDHLLQLINHPNPQFPSFTWDLSHCVELAGEDSRRIRPNCTDEHPFITETLQAMNEVTKKFARGKGWKAMKKLARESSKKDLKETFPFEDIQELKIIKPMAYNTFCKTRFATYLSDVINSNRINFPLQYQLLSKNDSKHGFKMIANAPYVLRMNGLYDFYNEVGNLFRTLQCPDIFTWTVDESIEDCFIRFDKMKEEFAGTEAPELTRRFHNAVEELEQRGCHKRCPIPGRGMIITSRTSEDGNKVPSIRNCNYDYEIDLVRKELESHVGNFQENFRKRLRKSQPEILKWTRNVFSVREIENRPIDTSPRWLYRLFKESEKARMYDTGVTFPNFLKEYQEFAVLVKERALQQDCNMNRDQAIYMEMLQTPSSQSNVMNLLASSISRTYCEAITEGMRSVVDNRLRGRERLSLEKLFQEGFMTWNGPSVGKRSEALIEAGLNRHFSGNPWRFHRRSDKRYLSEYDVSRVIDRKESTVDRMDPPEFFG